MALSPCRSAPTHASSQSASASSSALRLSRAVASPSLLPFLPPLMPFPPTLLLSLAPLERRSTTDLDAFQNTRARRSTARTKRALLSLARCGCGAMAPHATRTRASAEDSVRGREEEGEGEGGERGRAGEREEEGREAGNEVEEEVVDRDADEAREGGERSDMCQLAFTETASGGFSNEQGKEAGTLQRGEAQKSLGELRFATQRHASGFRPSVRRSPFALFVSTLREW